MPHQKYLSHFVLLYFGPSVGFTIIVNIPLPTIFLRHSRGCRREPSDVGPLNPDINRSNIQSTIALASQHIHIRVLSH